MNPLSDYHFDHYTDILSFCEHMREEPPTIDEWIAEIVTYRMTLRVCQAKGHDIVSETFAGPDIGHDEHECRRCGGSWSTTHY